VIAAWELICSLKWWHACDLLSDLHNFDFYDTWMTAILVVNNDRHISDNCQRLWHTSVMSLNLVNYYILLGIYEISRLCCHKPTPEFRCTFFQFNCFHLSSVFTGIVHESNRQLVATSKIVWNTTSVAGLIPLAVFHYISITCKHGSAVVVRTSCCSHVKRQIMHLSRAEIILYKSILNFDRLMTSVR